MFIKRYKLCLVMLASVISFYPVLTRGDNADSAVQLQVDTDGKQHIQVRGGSYFFKPDHIIVKVNIPVVLSISREWGIIPHTFVLKIPESGIMIDESMSTDPKTITFTPTVTGNFEFYCKNKFLFFKSHEKKGMKGTLEVIP